MFDDLRGKVALVTGAGRGIGAGIAARLVQEGCFVYVADVDAGAAGESAGQLAPAAAAMGLDVRDRAGLRAGVERVVAERGGLDILVNNAGLVTSGPFDSTTPEAFDALVAVNFTGVFNCVQAAVPAMTGRAGAAIVNIASVSAEKGGGAVGNVWYGATKAAVVAITKGLGRDLGPRGIRCNGIAPGVITTDMVKGHVTPETRDRFLARFPIGRFGEADDVARVVAFLASSASSFITGETIAVDGGFLRT